MNAVIVCVDFSDILQHTLAYNRHHFDKVLVVTDMKDYATCSVAIHNNAWYWQTNAFYRDGAVFNKWLALEEALEGKPQLFFDNKDGFMCVMDADVLWPKKLGRWKPKKGCIQGPNRRIKRNLREQPIVPPENEWQSFPIDEYQAEIPGYSQVFHLSDVNALERPWYDTSFVHAGISDSLFQFRWKPELRLKTPWECLHLGPTGQNWYGRTVEYLNGNLPQEHKVRIEMCNRIWENRNKNRKMGIDPYLNERIKQ